MINGEYARYQHGHEYHNNHRKVNSRP